jgi:hypothetical protein
VAAPSHHKDRSTVHGRTRPCLRKTPRGQLGFPKTRDELRELKEFADRQVRCDQWKKRWLWKTREEERIQFTRVMKPVTSGPESVLPAQRNVLNERGRLQSEGTQQVASIRLLFSTDKVFVLRLATLWVCVFPVFPTNKKNEPQFVLQT